MSAIFIAVDNELDVPPFQQIFEQIRALIQRGELASDALLPTVRQLAGDLDVAPNTVARAYTDLAAQGWIVSEGRRGTRVAGKMPLADRKSREASLREAAGQFITALIHRGYTRAEIASALRLQD
jgi:DNA-binding transcriptional regulator YhcF (GntR family)